MKNQKKGIMQKGFTLIELMVVIVIIGILSALAVPKMFGTSAKAKAAEAPGMIANWEKLQSAYVQESGAAGAWGSIGFTDPTATSMWFTYADGGASATSTTITAAPSVAFGECTTADTFVSTYTVVGDIAAHSGDGACRSYTPNF
jgi:prepilin-type N-terminal cleavage/methylation domain-containing protein